MGLQDEHTGDFLLCAKVEHVFDAAAFAGAGGLRDLIHALDIHAARVREEEQEVVKLRAEEMLDEVVSILLALRLAGLHAFKAFAAAALQAVFGGGRAFDAAHVRHRDDGGLVRDQIDAVDVAGDSLDASETWRGVLGFDDVQLVFDDGEHALLAGEDVEQVLDGGEDGVVFGFHLVTLHAGELIEAEFEDVIDLLVREDVASVLDARLAANEQAELLGGGDREGVGLQSGAGFVAVAAVADDLDEIIEAAEGEEEGFKLFSLHLGFSEQELRAADDDLAAVLDVAADGILDAENTRAVAVDGEHVDAEGGLQLGVLVEIVQHDLRPRILLQIDNEAGVLIRLISNAADLGDDFFVRELRDLLFELRTVHVVGDLRDDDLLAVAVFDDFGLSTDAHAAVARFHVIADAHRAHDGATRGEIRSFDMRHQLRGGDRGIVDLCTNRIHDLAEVMRRHIGGHTDCDAGAAIDEEVRKRRREHGGLGETFVVVRDEIDRVLVHVLHQSTAKVRHAGFGISHGRRRIAFHAAEVPLRIDQGLPHGPFLPHVDERRVNDRLTVRMVVTGSVTRDLRALHMLLRRVERQLMHRVKNTTLGGFEAVAHIRQRAGDNDGHRVVEEAVLHFVGDRDGACVGVLHQWNRKRVTSGGGLITITHRGFGHSAHSLR